MNGRRSVLLWLFLFGGTLILCYSMLVTDRSSLPSSRLLAARTPAAENERDEDHYGDGSSGEGQDRSGDANKIVVRDVRFKNLSNLNIPFKFQLVDRNRPSSASSNTSTAPSIIFCSEFSYDINVTPPVRFSEIHQALNITMENYPDALFVFVSNVSENRMPKFKNIPYDMYHAQGSITYGHPIELANLYPGWKVVASVDNVYPPGLGKFKKCKENAAYALARQSGNDLCSDYVMVGSYDGLFFTQISQCALSQMNFSRSNWGCEGLAAAMLMECGIMVPSLCPYFAPGHHHESEYRPPGRIRIDGERTYWPKVGLHPYCPKEILRFPVRPR